jgi:hypothetical protein
MLERLARGGKAERQVVELEVRRDATYSRTCAAWASSASDFAL